MKKSIFTLLLSGLAVTGLVHASSPAGDEGGVPASGMTWHLVVGNDLSGATQDEVETDGVTASIGSVLEGGVLEGLPWCWALQDSWPSDNLCLQVAVEEAGTYRFSYRARLASVANPQANIVADLRYGEPGAAAYTCESVSEEYAFTQSDELPGTLMESAEFELQPGTYNFYVFLKMADYCSGGSTFFVGDFNLYQLREGEPPVMHTVTWTVGQPDLAEVAVLDAATGQPVVSGGTVADGTEVLVTVAFTDPAVFGEIRVNGEVFDSFTYESCSGSYSNEGNGIVVNGDMEIVVDLDVAGGLSANEVGGVTVCPTRFADCLTVGVPADGEVSLYDMAGTKVLTAAVDAGANVLGLGGLGRGIYLLRVDCGAAAQVVRVVKE